MFTVTLPRLLLQRHPQSNLDDTDSYAVASCRQIATVTVNSSKQDILVLSCGFLQCLPNADQALAAPMHVLVHAM